MVKIYCSIIQQIWIKGMFFSQKMVLCHNNRHFHNSFHRFVAQSTEDVYYWKKIIQLNDISGSRYTIVNNGPLTRYAKLRVAHALGIPGTLSQPLRVSDTDVHHATCVMHVPWCMPGSLTSSYLWSRWRENRSRHSRCMRSPQFCISGKSLMARYLIKHKNCKHWNRMIFYSHTIHIYTLLAWASYGYHFYKSWPSYNTILPFLVNDIA